MFTSLKAKFIIATVLILTAAIGASSWRTLKMQRDQLIAASEEKVLMLTDTIERSITTAMRKGRSKDVQAIVQEVGRHEDIDRLWIFDDEGRIRISSRPEEIGKRLTPSRLEHYMGYIKKNEPFVFDEEENGRKVHSIIKPIINRPECYGCHEPSHKVTGVLHIDLSLTKAKAQIASIHKFVLLSAILTISSLSLGLWLLLSRLVTRPVSSLIKTMGKAEKGDLSTRVRIKSRDELGQLGRSFNSMIGRLDAAQRELQRRHEAGMLRADKLAALGKLAAGVAHEINNPLSGMQNCVRTLLKGSKEQGLMTQYLSLLQDGLKRIEEIVKQLLNFSQKAEFQMRPTDANSILNKSIELLNFDLSNRGIQVISTLDPYLDSIPADPEQLEQVFLNLLINALEAMPNGGELRVRTARQDGWVVIEISDTGFGIPPENLERIFDPFFTTKGVGEGTGLGLSVSYGIVQRHRGSIEVESQVGIGSTFSIKLPIRGDRMFLSLQSPLAKEGRLEGL